MCFCAAGLQNGIGADIPTFALQKMSYAPLQSRQGILFATYSSLVSRSGKRSRLDQIIEWLSESKVSSSMLLSRDRESRRIKSPEEFDGCIILDECHRAKNLYQKSASAKGASKCGLAVAQLQKVMKMARIVYSSATGVTQPYHMAYMSRLGL